jgi:hypothetical protein
MIPEPKNLHSISYAPLSFQKRTLFIEFTTRF